MSLSKRDKLVKTIFAQGFSHYDDKIVAVTPGEFFDGNEDEDSFGRHLDPHPGIESLQYHLERFANRYGIEILVEIFEINEDDEDSWPSSERVYLIGEVDTPAVAELLSDVLASGVEDRGDMEINDEKYSDVKALWWE